MSRKFTLHKRYYGEDYDLYKKKTITIKEGLTVLVGCNGIGKTTLLRQIKDHCKKEDIPVLSFDNLKEGGWTCGVLCWILWRFWFYGNCYGIF